MDQLHLELDEPDDEGEDEPGTTDLAPSFRALAEARRARRRGVARVWEDAEDRAPAVYADELGEYRFRGLVTVRVRGALL